MRAHRNDHMVRRQNLPAANQFDANDTAALLNQARYRCFQANIHALRQTAWKGF
jgi:hypothetical protein